MDFAVRAPGDPENKGHWVMAVDPAGERFLIAGDDGKFKWVPTDRCQLLKIVSPELPHPVVVVQPQQKIVMPSIAQIFNGNNQ